MRISDWSSDVCSSDLISECELLTFEDRDGGVAAVGWIVHHDYLGALPRRARIGGIRLRAGDIQVGDHQVLIDYFAEPRFNSWAVAEIQVLDRRIIPNARRDFFEHNETGRESIRERVCRYV